MNVLVIYSHSYQEQSLCNRTIVQTLEERTDYRIRNLEVLYPDGQIDIAAEQEALLWAEVIVLQHPLYWYNVPSMMKRWLDEVFTFGFAYGDNGSLLRGRRLVHSFTAAAQTSDVTEDMLMACTNVLRHSASFCELTFAGAVYTLGLLPAVNPNCEQESREHAERLVRHIDSLG